ncbi:hypothetical protein [Streptomyces brevispora]|nr:hypothetical protein [Streptomyces brevispora]
MSRVFLGAALTPDNGAPVPDDRSLDMPDQFTAAERIARNRGITSQWPPSRRRCGEVNGGWRLITAQLNHERNSAPRGQRRDAHTLFSPRRARRPADRHRRAPAPLDGGQPADR